MPKRTAEEKIQRYNRKIRKLQEKSQRRNHRVISSDEEYYHDIVPEDPAVLELDGSPNEAQVETSAPAEIASAPETAATAEPGPVTQDTPNEDNSVTIDPVLLSALGASTADTPEFGNPIHESLANLWNPLLKKGLSSEDKNRLFKQYLIPNNCTLLQSPRLNPEISAAVSEVVRMRDKKISICQQHLGAGMSAINQAAHLLLCTDDKTQVLKYLSDGCRILSDVHYDFTKDRIKLITPSLDKNFIHMIQDSVRDDFLFGNTLADKIKASKAIEKQGQQIKKALQKPNSGQALSAGRTSNQGNWSGPPRYSSNRGGRGGHRRTTSAPAPPAASRRQYPSSTMTSSQSKRTNQNKTYRATPQ